MRKLPVVLVVLVLGLSFLLAVVTSVAAEHKYVGYKQCICHKGPARGDQVGIWQKSAHANAYKSLLTKEADEIAKKKGLKVAAKDVPQCLECHLTGGGKIATLAKENGVQCETCHGPGSDYKAMNVMKDMKLAMEKGLILAKDDPKLCEKCHNKQSPTFKGFDYKKYWAKIAHPLKKA